MRAFLRIITTNDVESTSARSLKRMKISQKKIFAFKEIEGIKLDLY